MKKKSKGFVVWTGRVTGVFRTWEECKPHVHRFHGAKHLAFNSLEDAVMAFNGSYDDAMLKKTGRIKSKATPLF